MLEGKPNWYKLIFFWCRRHTPTGFGLTLPFIVGAIENMTITKLLIEIKDSNFEEKIIIRECSNLNEYVLAFDEIKNPISQYLLGEGGLRYENDKLESIGSFEEISNYLEDRYASPILNKTFSKNIRTNMWEEYNQDDNDIIDKALLQ